MKLQNGAEVTTAPQTVLLIEDDAPIRARLAAALSEHGIFKVVQAPDLATARAAIASQTPDLIVSDLKLPDGIAIGLLAEVREKSPQVEILVITILGDEATIVAAIAAGASGYLLKDALPEDIHKAAIEVMEGGSPISPSIARFILRRAGEIGSVLVAPMKPAVEVPHLTPRELEILWGIAKGLSYNEIASLLEMSPNTVPTHIKAIYRKLQVGTRGEAVYEAIQQGLITF
ncbi:response regulator [Brevundimonas sp.]|uniref:response regulator n=1 Tax=Brevundimonas sp. TaxID=1871086 RepID=UPI003F6E9CB6